MTIPSPLRTSRDAGNPALAYRSGEGGTPAAFGAQEGQALQGLGNQLQSSGARLSAFFKAREDKTDRFTSLTNFSDFESEVSSRLDELKRGADPSGKGFAAQAEAEYERLRQEFLINDVSPELKEEFRYRTEEVKRGLIADVLDFQYKAGDAYFRQGIADELNKAQIAIDKDPKQMEAWRARLDEAINTSDLSEIEKEEVRRKAYIGLEGVAYKGVVKEAALAGGGTVQGEIGVIIDSAATKYGQDPAVLRKIAWLESRGNPNAKNPASSAEGLFQFIDSTAQDYGLTNKRDAGQSADAGARLLRDNREGLKKVLGREPTPGELYLAHQQGLGGAKALLQHPNRMAVDVIGRDAVIGNGGTSGMTAGEFASLWNQKMGGSAVDFAGDIDNNPAYQHVPYEDRLAFRKDAEVEVNRMLADQAAIDKQQLQLQQNALMNGIMDGTAGQKDIDDAYDSGVLFDYDDRKKAQDALDTRNKEYADYGEGIAKISAGENVVWDPTSEKDQKLQNALMRGNGTAPSILSRVVAGDKEVFTNAIVPLVQQTHDISTDLIGSLTGMVRSSSQGRALYALDALSQLQDADPRAFAARTNDALASDVALYRSQRDLVPQDQLMGIINGGTTQEERTRTKMLREEGQQILTAQTKGVPKLDELIADVVGSTFDPGIFSSAHASTYPQAAIALKQEYQALFIEAYGKTGNVDSADALVKQELQRNWGVTSVGDAGVLMKYPPEKVGYRQVEGSYDWMQRQLEVDTKLQPGERAQLIADQKTEEEVRKWKAGKGPAPSYQAVVFDSNGVPRLSMGQNGRPLRYNFEITEFDKAKELQHAVNLQKQFEYEKFMRVWARAEELQFTTGTAIPKEIADEKERLEKELEAEPDPRKFPSPYNEIEEKPIPAPFERPLPPPFMIPSRDSPEYRARRAEHERVRAKLKEMSIQ